MVTVVARSQIPRDKLDEFVQTVKDNTPKVRNIPGLKRIDFLCDRSTGRCGTVSYWESAESLKTGGQDMQALREQTISKLGGTIESVEAYEVVHSVGAEVGAAR